MTFKVIKDGDRLHILIDGYTPCMEETISKFITEQVVVSGLESVTRQEEVPTVPIAQEVSHKEIVTPSVSVQGLNPDNVRKMIEKGFSVNGMSPNDQATVMQELKACLRNDLELRVNIPDVFLVKDGEPGSIQEFFHTYEALIEKITNTLLVKYAVGSLGEFLSGDKKVVKQEYDAIVSRLFRKMNT